MSQSRWALVAVGVTGLKLLGAPFWLDDVFNGTALIIGVLLSRFELRQIRRLRRRRAAAAIAEAEVRPANSDPTRAFDSTNSRQEETS